MWFDLSMVNEPSVFEVFELFKFYQHHHHNHNRIFD